MVNGVGAIIGPLVTSALIGTLGTAAFWWSLAVIHLAVLMYLTYRIALKDAVAVEDQSTYQPVPARSSPIASLVGRRLGKRKDSVASRRGPKQQQP